MSAPAQTPSSPPDENVIAPLDPAHPFTPKPLIADILRTRYCVPGSVFLVESVDSSIAVGSKYRAVRTLLGDGELCIQALLGAEMHGFVDDGQVYAGCYVRIDRFEVRWVNLAGGVEDVEDDGAENLAGPLRRRRGHEKMVYLLVEDLVTVGWNNAYLGMLKTRQQETDPIGRQVNSGANQGAVMGKGEHFPGDRAERNTGAAPSVSEAKPSDPRLPAKAGDMDSVGVPEPGNKAPDLDDVANKHTSELPADRGEDPPKQQANAATRTQDVAPHWASDDATKPLKLTSLRAIPSLPYKQNWMVNVLAIVASLSEVEPSHLPPYHQRTARLADPSTNKQVLLTVFLDPDDFNPRVGSVVLILGVKNHRFDGGSLKKYSSDRPKHGRRWWFEEPLELGWCDVAGLRRWWDGQQRSGLENQS
ncbi:hypothetical protein QBC33DRAFT_520720 [Phialemonium atrogriseum]|uniref:Uncharacterized protein n=1 Tax=Phialemonium atrogriseum TaxID=1093897 RepID=A0AAJ0C9Z4_9PEZI|nr:uncharacterized protein QBC33DRAFT_520720 [Phialemonium atrogriseum]KAK1772277.1 hypothetical protein QBC33DRAFT_520720 [Phialemonium atrogriseum]